MRDGIGKGLERVMGLLKSARPLRHLLFQRPIELANFIFSELAVVNVRDSATHSRIKPFALRIGTARALKYRYCPLAACRMRPSDS